MKKSRTKEVPKTDAAEYDGGKVDQKDAEAALRDAQRFLEFVIERVR